LRELTATALPIRQKSGQRSIYETLDDQRHQMRLLTLAPSEDYDADIHCHLKKFDARSSPVPEYAAVSYVWGDLPPTSSIIINDQSFWVRAYMCTVLHYVRRKIMPRRLWIDALCINQLDAIEKPHQIHQVGYIYTNAVNVLIWLS
jgi:hypothetical protein